MDFLATVITDEIARRSQKKLASALRRANFRNQKTLEEFDFSFNPNLNRQLILELASCRFIEEKVCVLIVGPCGTGKSHIAQAWATAPSAPATMCCSPRSPRCSANCTPPGHQRL